MRKTKGIILILILLSITAAVCHTPLKAELDFDLKTGILKVTFTHKVRDAKQHFVYQAVVKVNKQVLIEQTMEQQDDTNGGSLVYKLPGVKPGDTITVSLSCNKGGTKTTILEITENEKTD